MRKLIIVCGVCIFWLIFILGCGALVDESEAIRTLEAAGYTEVSCPTSNWVFASWSGCSKEDDVAFKCTAVNPGGVRVKLVVCSNALLKGSTIRH